MVKVEAVRLWDIEEKKYIRFNKLDKLWVSYEDDLIVPKAGYEIHIVKKL